MTAKKTVLINVNTASFDELTTVSGIGEALAREIIDHRPYSELNDLVNVSGISETKLEGLKPCLTVKKSDAPQGSVKPVEEEAPTQTGDTEAFVFLEDRNERQDALLIIFGGFILGLVILLLRRKDR